MSVLEPTAEVAADTKTDAPRLGRAKLVLRRFVRNKPAVLGTIGFILVVLFAIFGGYFTRWTYTDVDVTSFLTPPNAQHWWGTTQDGRDVYALTVKGLRKSLVIGISVAAIQTTLAALIGSAAAYFGKAVDRTILWLIDLLLVVPAFLLVSILTQKTGANQGSTGMLIFLLAGFSWMITARVIRAMTLSVISLDYVRAARYMSVPSWVIIIRHVIPNVSSYLIIDATLGVVSAVISETVLSYFGFGVQAPETSLGTLLSSGQSSATTFPWIFLAPALILILLLVCVNLMGDGLRDALDPSSKSGGQA